MPLKQFEKHFILLFGNYPFPPNSTLLNPNLPVARAKSQPEVRYSRWRLRWRIFLKFVIFRVPIDIEKWLRCLNRYFQTWIIQKFTLKFIWETFYVEITKKTWILYNELLFLIHSLVIILLLIVFRQKHTVNKEKQIETGSSAPTYCKAFVSHPDHPRRLIRKVMFIFCKPVQSKKLFNILTIVFFIRGKDPAVYKG